MYKKTLPKQCLHSRVPGGFSSDPVRGRTGFRRVCGRHVCVLFTVLRPCRLRHSAAKWSPMASNREKHNGFHDFPLPGPTWPHMPSRCVPDAPQMAPDAPQMAPNSTVWVLALESFYFNLGNPLFLIFRTHFLAKNNPRRERCRLAQRLYPVQRARSVGIMTIL